MNYKTLWQETLSRLAIFIGKAPILSLFKDSVILESKDNIVTIGVPTSIACQFIRERYEIRLLELFRQALPGTAEIRFEVRGSLLEEDHPHKVDLKLIQGDEDKKLVRKLPNRSEVVMKGGMRSKMFNPRYTLANFIPGQENRLVHAACLAVAAKPSNIYNPLFIYGGVGLGKTHLLQGVGHEILKNYPQKNVVYMTSERFINEVVEAIGKRHTLSFKERYRNVDCLIVDDIQFFGNKSSTQQEFFHTFNELYDAGKQIILSSDRPPKDLDGLEERLKSRFGMGMVVEVIMPEVETRRAILNEKCQEHQVLIEPEILECIAQNVHESVRELEGVLIQIIAEMRLTQTTPTLQSTMQVINRLNRKIIPVGESAKPAVTHTVDDIITAVVAHFKVEKNDLLSTLRKKEIMVPRQICMYLIREILHCSYESIGENFGGKNHTTVLHAYQKIAQYIHQDDAIRRHINTLKRDIGVL